MLPLYHDPHFTFRFADDRLIPRFHLEDIEAVKSLVSRIGSDQFRKLIELLGQ